MDDWPEDPSIIAAVDNGMVRTDNPLPFFKLFIPVNYRRN